MDAVSVPGYVTRILPPQTDEKENKIYYEFVDFYAVVTDQLYLVFEAWEVLSDLQTAVGKKSKDIWTDEDRLYCSVLLIQVYLQNMKHLGGKETFHYYRRCISLLFSSFMIITKYARYHLMN